jgi:NAD(P)-dependent dehydrogenase (short-subunit alcohol dehydrogenase family)
VSIFKDGLFAGKHVFVTGGSSGINLGIVTAFAGLGARVSLNGRKLDKLEAAVAGLTSQGYTAAHFAADVRDFTALEAAITAAVARHGPIDVLICGAAGNFPAPAVAMSTNGFKAVVDIDLVGTFNAARAAFEHLTKPGAAVIAISAPQAAVAYPMQAHVCAAKAGVDMLVKTLSLEWGPAGVRVVSIWPGPIEGTEGMERLAGDAESKQKIERALPLQRFGTKDEVAQLALFLASAGARYCTGGVYTVDGGMSLIGGSLLSL